MTEPNVTNVDQIPVKRGLYRKPEVPETEQDPDAEANATPDKDLAPEEATFKKRYADLRRFQEKQKTEHEKQIEALRTQLADTTKNSIPELPARKEDLEAWTKKYPDVARIVESIAEIRASKKLEELQPQLLELEEAKEDAKRSKAEAVLARLHPDFDALRDSPDFHEWAEKQPKVIQSLLYEAYDDPYGTARAIDLYKTDKVQPKQRVTKRDAALAVTPHRSQEPTGDQKKIWKASEIKRLSSKQFEKVEAEIDLAAQEGRIENDL